MGEYSGVVQELFPGRSQAAQLQASTSVEDDPQRAARATQLSRDTGMPAEVIYPDLDNFDLDHKARLTSDLIQGNDHLSEYITSHPMAAKVSNNDWHNLDSVSQAMRKIGPVSIIEKAIEGFKEGFDAESLGEWVNAPELAKKDEWYVQNYPKLYEWWKNEVRDAGLVVELPARTFTGLLHALQKGGSEGLQQFGMDESDARRAMRDTAGMVEGQVMSRPGQFKPFADARRVIEAGRKAEAYIRAGKEPPVGIDPEIDKLHQKQNDQDLKGLNDLTAAVKKASTTELDPEAMERFIRLRDDGVIGVNAEAVAELYKGKRPTPDDGLLGWVPDLEQKMVAALATGGDIDISKASWVTRVEPEVSKQLNDFIRVRPNGITKYEGEVLSQSLMVEAYHGSGHEFDAFSMEKIGTGQGAQSYGHGLYFAENRGVAETYKGEGQVARVNGQPFSPENPLHRASALIFEYGDKAIEHAKGSMELNPGDSFYESVYNHIARGNTPKLESPSNLYRVRIHADKEQFLDWDRPLSEQHENVRAIMAKLGQSEGNKYLERTGQSAYESLKTEAGRRKQTDFQREKFGDAGAFFKGSSEEASKMLREAGIPGIKYLDQGSRGETKADIQKKIDALDKKYNEFLDDPDKAEREQNIDAVKISSRMRDQMGNLREQYKLAPETATYNFVLFDDSLIEITHKNDQAVASVRQAGGLEPLVEKFRQGIREEKIGDLTAEVTETYTKYEEAINTAVNKVLDRIVGEEVRRQPGVKLKLGETEVQGVYTAFKGEKPIIGWSLSFGNALNVARHEAIHHLREYGFFKEGEWDTLVAAAMDGDWIKKHNIDERYEGLSKEAKFEEAIAEEFSKWYMNDKAPHIASTLFQKIHKLLVDIKEAIAQVLGHEPTYEELFSAAETGLLKKRGQQQESMSGSQKLAKGPAQGELDVTRQEDKKIFATISGWMNKIDYLRYQELINERNKQDAEWQLKRAERLERAKQGAEWKENRSEIREQIESGFGERPDISALEFFRSGKLYGEETGGRPRVDPMQLTKEQQALFPEKYQRRDGMAPEDAARLFGYTSFDELAKAVREHDDAIGERRGAREYIDKLIDDEADRQMMAKYGDLEENILREAQEHVISPTQIDLLWEEFMGATLATNPKAEMPFTKGDFKAAAKYLFQGTLAAKASMEKYLRDSGKAWRMVEQALLKEDEATAVINKQRQLNSLMMADEAKRFGRLKDRTENLIERYAKNANLPAVEQAYTDQIHHLLQAVGQELRRTPENVELSAQGVKLEDFIRERNAAGDGIHDPNLPLGKTLDQFTVAEYEDFAKTLKTLDYNGREARKVTVGTEALERADAVTGVVDGLRDQKKFDPDEPIRLERTRNWLRWGDAKLVKVEQLADWIDKNDPRGWFNQTVVRPMFAALGKRGDLISELAKDAKAIPVDRAWGRRLNTPTENTWLRRIMPRPDGKLEEKASGAILPLTHENKIAIALNMGNESSRSVLLRGMGWSESDVVSYLSKNMNDMDWKFVDGIWRMFDKLAPLVVEATSKRQGVPIEMVKSTPIGPTAGGYYPLIKDPAYSLLHEKVEGDLVNRPIYQPLPQARALKLRTGMAYPLDLSLNSIHTRINETVHAALFQEPIKNARKITEDATVRRAVQEAYGPEYVKAIDEWIKDIANNGGESSDARASWISRNMRENVVFGLMAWRVSTALIHGMSAMTASAYEVGPKALAKNLAHLGLDKVMPNVARRFFANEDAMLKQVEWAHETFPELRNRQRDIGRDMHAQLQGLVRKGFLDDAARFRAVNIVWGMKMVQALDQLTATPTAIAAYHKALAEGWTQKEAIYAGEKAVRLAHGSASLVGRANVGRGEVGKWMTIAYNGYWNHNYNRLRSAGRDVIDADIEYSDRLKGGSGALTALVIAPALIHYAVRGTQNDTYTGMLGEAILSQFGGTVPIVNTLMHSILHDRDPHVSPFDELLTKVWNVEKDAKKLTSGQKAEKWLRHGAEAAGFLTGLGPSGAVAQGMQFIKDVVNGKEQPKDIIEWGRGVLFTGHAKPRKKKGH